MPSYVNPATKPEIGIITGNEILPVNQGGYWRTSSWNTLKDWILKDLPTTTQEPNPAQSLSHTQLQIAATVFGKPVANTTLMRFIAVSRFQLPQNLLDSQAHCTFLPEIETPLYLYKNTELFGSITFYPQTEEFASSKFATLSSVPIIFMPRDELIVKAPNFNDATLSDLEWTLVGNSI